MGVIKLQQSIRQIYNLNLTNMQRLYCPITPQKRTLSAFNDDCALRELSPFHHPQLLPSHRKNNKLELLQSPTPVHNDLFSQLLASGGKMTHESCLPESDMMEEQFYDELEYMELNSSEEGESQSMGEIDEESDCEGVKKRKRKSTAQIKILKQELEVEPNWSKDKIVEMSDLTGLSQSQVYKWWWDQKKKGVKGDRDAFAKMVFKRKQIRKDLSKRASKAAANENDKENGFGYELEEPTLATKVKVNVQLEQLQATERKINKRLVFS